MAESGVNRSHRGRTDTWDRTVHAHYPGMEIVRYDRAGKWYLEPTIDGLKRQRVTIDEAAEQAVWGTKEGTCTIHAGRPGGMAFDRKVRDLLLANPAK